MILTPATQRRLRRRAGFTLLEVLVVVAILVILSTVAVVATTRYLEDARKSRAQLQCKSLQSACEAYYLNSQSGNNYPQQLTDLLNPFGGTGGTASLLKNGQQDLIDPWNNQYQYTVETMGDGSQQPRIFTIARDGTPISEKGIGQQAQLNQQ